MAAPGGRRRLTVLGPNTGEASGEGADEEAQQAGLDQFLKENKSALALFSKLDSKGKRREPFKPKDTGLLASKGMDEEQKEQLLGSVGFACMKGKKPESPNQDSFSVHIVEGQYALYGVYDGHGPNGHDVSDYVRQNLVLLFQQHSQRSTDPKSALMYAFTECQKQVEKLSDEKELEAEMSGATCTMAYHDFQRDLIWVAHVGDSRAVLGIRSAGGGTPESEDATVDHKPDLEKEKKRITTANPPGRVIFDGFYNHRVFAQGALYPGLNMSRAIGDVLGHREAGLTAEPDVREIDIKEYRGKKEVFLLLCTDGVWEFIESKKAVATCFNQMDLCRKEQKEPGDGPKPSQIAIDVLAKASYDAWMKDSDNEISDDITGISVCLC